MPHAAVVGQQHERVVAGEPQVKFREAGPLCPQYGDGARVDVDDTRPAGLRRPDLDRLALAVMLDQYGAAADRHLRGGQVDVAPAQRERLAPPHPGRREQLPRDEQLVLVVAGPAEERRELGRRPVAQLRCLGLRSGRRLRSVGRVHREQPVLDGVPQCAVHDRVDVADGPRRQSPGAVDPAGGLQLAVQGGEPLAGEDSPLN